jgi:hypothetical protein
MRRIFALSLGLLLLEATSARAELIDLKNGMIYDSLQDLTWMQDIRHARTSGAAADGLLSSVDAVAWAASLEFGGYSDWRLPHLFDDNLLNPNHSEVFTLMDSLGWVLEAPPAGVTSIRPGPGLNYAAAPGWGPFVNPSALIWTPNAPGFTPHPSCANPISPTGCVAWSAFYGLDLPAYHSNMAAAWAVRDGSPYARVPEPSTLLMASIGALALVRRRSPSV